MILVDDVDRPLLEKYTWRISPRGYVRRSNGKNHKVLLHREIMEAKKGQIIDHINGNKLDNRRSNLRFCTVAENSRNVSLRKDNKTGYKGVHYATHQKIYRASIKVDGKSIYLGGSKDINKAVELYRQGAIKYHKEFARF